MTLADKYLTWEKKELLNEKAIYLLIDTFNKIYLEICNFYNYGEIINVVYNVDPHYDGIAMCSGNKITFNPEWLKKNPWDTDCITHELIHVAQNYRFGCPFWICEGIADYGRAKFGLYNEKVNWNISGYRKNQSYTNGYNVTAAFFVWIEKTIDIKFCERFKLYNQIRQIY